MQDYLENSDVLLGDLAYRTEVKDNGGSLTVTYFDIDNKIIGSRTCKKICVSDSSDSKYSFGGGVWIPKPNK